MMKFFIYGILLDGITIVIRSLSQKIILLFISPARIKNELIGFIDVVSDGYNDAYILDLMVAKDYQSLGLGTKLMEEALLFLKKKQIKCIQVTFDSKLIGFYRRFGFHIFSAGIIDKDDPTLMEHKLS